MKVAYLFFLLMMLTSCSTLKEMGTSRADIHGMIYDLDNQPISGYTLILSGLYSATSDINGRILLSNVPLRSHQFTGSGSGYLKEQGTLEIPDRRSIIYLSIASVEQLYIRVLRAIEQGDLESAGLLLAKIPDTEFSTVHYAVCNALFFFRAADFQKAFANLETIQFDSRTPEINRFINLLKQRIGLQ